MNEDFKIKVFFSDSGEDLEKILSNYFINKLTPKTKQNS